MMEMRQETDYVNHHVQKVVGFFLAMRHFAKELQQQGHRVIYFRLDDPDNQQSLADQLPLLIENEGITRFEYQLPDEFRLDQLLQSTCASLGIPCQAVDTEHFLTSREFLNDFFKGKRLFSWRPFTGKCAKKYQVLMDGKEPITGSGITTRTTGNL
jgi:deoxyribodipyrimidine photolyase-related protein